MKTTILKLAMATIITVCASTAVHSQVVVELGHPQVNMAPQPNCPYGYYGSAPYECAGEGYYGSEYFYNGIFLGVGPWSNWGYNHGWGNHRFNGSSNGRYDNRHAERSMRQERARRENGGNHYKR